MNRGVRSYMDEKYFAEKIEQKWQKKWAESGAFHAEIDGTKPKFFQLEMLPYPSGNLHMGHVRNYSVGDAIAWYKRLRGFNVLHPIGWDSFGQPAEDAAVKRGVNPRTWTEENIETMRGQLERMGLSYDWRRQMFAHRPGVLQVGPMVLPEDVRDGSRLQEKEPGKLVRARPGDAV